MPTKDEILSIGIDVDIKAATKQMGKFQKSVLKHMQAVTKAINSMGKVNEKMTSTAVKDTEEWADATDGMSRNITDLEKKLAKAGKEESTTIKENIKFLKDLQKQRTKSSGGAGGGKDKGPMGDPKAFGKDAKAGMKEAADEFKGSISSFFQKDLKGVVTNLGKLLGRGFKGAGRGILRGGEALKTGGAKMRTRGADVGGMKGSAMKGVGKMMGGIGKMVGFLGKLGPLLSLAATAMMSLVQLFIDADGAAKDFQKGILASTGNIEFLAEAGSNANVAFLNMEDVLREVRDAAFDASENLDWGITAETHMAVLNVLNQEGASIKRIADEAARGMGGLKKFVAETVHVSVAYSRAFGVSLSEVGQMQGEMMTELGMNLDSTKLAFTQMARSATESGIASNKFFAMIRGVSQDLSLYNLRIEDAAKLLGKLGKVMNPRSAGQFMQTISSFMKNMDIDSRMRMQLLAGKKGGVILEKDIQRRSKNLQKDLESALGDAFKPKMIAAALKDPKLASEMWEKLRKVAPTQAGALRGSAARLKTAQIAQGKGVYGRAVAMRNMGAVGSLQMAKASLGVGKGRTLQGARGGLGFEKFAQMLSIDEEMLAGMIAFETALEDQREDLLREAHSKEQKDRIRAMDEADLLNSMTDEQKKTVESSTKVEDLAKKQTSLQQSMLEKLKILTDFMMNQLFNAMMGIWDAMPALPEVLGGGRAEAQEKAKIERRLLKSKDKEMRELAGKDLSLAELKTALKSKITRPSSEIEEAQRKIDKLEFERSQVTPQDLKSQAMGSLGALGRGRGGGQGPTRDIDAEIKAAEAARDAVAAREGGAQRERAISATDWSGQGRVRQALERAGVGTDVSASAATGLNIAGGDVKGMDEVFKMYKIGQQNQEAFYKALLDNLDPSELVDMAEESAEQNEKTKEITKAGAKGSAATAHALTTPSTAYFKFSTPFFNVYKKGMGETFLDALREALFEYWQYSGLDRKEVGKAMAAGNLTSVEFAKKIGEEVAAGKVAGAGLGLEGGGGGDGDGGDGGGGGGGGRGGKPSHGIYGGGKWEERVPGGASGLMITGHVGEIAKTRSLGNEYLVGGRPGEVMGTPDRLARAFGGGGGGGGGGGVIEVRLKGDARQLFEAVVVDKVHDMQRRARSS